MKKLIHYFIPTNIEEDAESQRKARLTLAVLLIIAYFNVNYIVISLLINYQGGLISQIPLFLISLTTLFLYKKNFPSKFLYPFYFISCSISIAITVFYSGGYSSNLFPWLASTPIVALLVWSKKGSRFSLLFVLILEIIFFYLYKENYKFPNQIQPSVEKIFNLTINLGLVVILYWIAVVFENAKNGALFSLNEKNRELEIEKEKSETLLLNILPESVAEELKETGISKARLFSNVTVIFIDFVGFTTVSENLTPQELVHEIDHCFKNFDAITTEFGLEKIKTVGDAYIAVAGLPLENELHASMVINAGIAISNFMNKYCESQKKEGKPFFEFRMGINTGSVVAGIVGIKKFAYDIWGDTVNIAARMEQNSEPGRINVSRETYELVKDKFDFEYRGKIEAKNKGAIDMYFLNF